MKIFLLPRVFHIIGWILLVPGIIFGIISYFSLDILPKWSDIIINDIAIIGVAVGALFIVCSKEKREDEMTRSIRLSALLKSFYCYVAFLVVSTIVLNGYWYWLFMCLNLVLFLIIYVIIFRVEMYRYNQMSEEDEE